MAAALPRRRTAVAAVAAIATAIAPFALSLAIPTSAAVAASAPPAMDETTSAPMQGGALYGTGENITAVFDQQIAGNQGTSSSTTCSATSGAGQCAFVLYEINADGSRGLRLPGNTQITKSGSNPLTAIPDTVTFNPDFNLANGGTYEAVVQVFGVDSNGKAVPSMVTNLDYRLYVSTTKASKLSAPATATTGNNKAFPLSGYAPPGFTVSVDVASQDPTGQSDAKGSEVVPPCSAISCPWTIKVDISGSPQYMSPTTDVDWTATVADANGQPGNNDSSDTTDAATQSPKATFNIEYTPPAMPTSVNIAITNNTTTHTAFVTVSAKDSDTATKSYLVTVTDPSSNVVQQSYPAQGTDLPSTNLDISALNDGTVHIVVQAADSFGNVSSECDSNPVTPTCTSADKQKLAGLTTSLTTSVISSGSGDTTFSNAQNQTVQTPTRITIGFTQPIKASYMDCDCTGHPPTPVTHTSSLSIQTPNGNQIASGGTPTVASDNMSISFPISGTLPDGKYTLAVTTYSKDNCPDGTAQSYASNGGKAPSCESYSDYVRVPGTGSPATPFQFTVDSTPPTVTISSITNPVTATTETSVNAAGTATKGVTTVQLLYTSAGSQPTKLLVNAGVTQPSDPSVTTATWSAGPTDLSSFPDGPVTVKVTAKKPSGLSGSVTQTITMKAHITAMSEQTDHATVTANHAIHISGHLSDENGNPIANATIAIRPKYSNGKLGSTATAVTDSSGAYSQIFVPQFTATYIATYAGGPTHDPVTARSARTVVRAAVSLTGNGSQSSPVKVTGNVSPNKHGKTVVFYELTSSGKKKVGSAKLNSSSRFTAHLRLPKGKDKLIAVIGATSGNASGQSSVLVIHVS